MFDSIKDSLIKNIDDQLNVYGEALKEATDELVILDSYLKYYEEKKYSFFDKIFNKKKIENDFNMLKKNKLKSVQLSNRVTELTQSMKKLSIERHNIKTANGFVGLGFDNVRSVYKYCDENDVKLTEEDEIALQSNSIEFMSKIIEKDTNYIQYDRTNDIEIYRKFLELQIEKKSNDNIYCKYAKQVLERLKEPDAMIDSIKKQFNLYVFELYRKNPDVVFSYDEILNMYLTKECVDIENLYLNTDVIVGVHGTGYITDNIKDNKIFIEGLRNSTQPNAVLKFHRTVTYQNLAFLDILNYDASCVAGAKLGLNYNYLVLIPKSALVDSSIPIWGSDNIDSDENYILPQYVYGYFRKRENGTLELVKNPFKNTHKYANYYSFDGKLIDKIEEFKK